MAERSTNKKTKTQAGIRLVMLAAILLCVNMLASRFHAGLDLTKEKRFTLTNATKRMLRQVEDAVIVDIYLKGKFPAGFKKLAQATDEKLQSMKQYTGGKLIYRFTDPFEGKSENEKLNIAQNLYNKGVEPVSLNVKEEDNSSRQIIYPYALVNYKGKYQAVRLLENHFGMTPLEVLNYSESLLEYKLANAIHKLQMPEKPTIGYIMGHGEQLGIYTEDLLNTLKQYYYVDTIDLPHEYHINDAVYKAIIINKPTLPFDEKEKFKIDQYIMHGGSVLWAIDKLYTPIDSLRQSGYMLTMDYDLNLDDQLFKYGVRINSDLIEDVVCNRVPIITGTINTGQPQIELRPWTFFPIFTPSSKHPIVHNMDAIMGKFVSSIDTIERTGATKTILLQSSNHSRTAPSPVRISLNMMRYNPDPKLFTKPYRPAAVLLEGSFSSLYENRMTGEFLQLLRDSLHYAFKNKTDSTARMIVIADGDMLLNEYSDTKGVQEMGYWEYTGYMFANKNFILNCLEYLTDPNSLLEARSKDLKLRLLDVQRAKTEKTKWQIINTAAPIGLILIFASCYIFFRKRRYETKTA